MAKIMMTVKVDEGTPTLQDIQQKFSLSDDEIDPAFGLIEVDPAEHLFTFLVEETAIGKITNPDEWRIQGPYSNPRIEPFGLEDMD